MESAELKQLIDRFLNNTATTDERKLVDAWYESFNEKDRPVFLTAEEEQQLKADIYNEVKGYWHRPPFLIRALPALKYAAAAILVISAYLGFHKSPSKSKLKDQNNYQAINTGTREVKKIDLPDGSEVWLNANSHIRISQDFQHLKERCVYLDEGEAFFKVKHDVTRPFFVFTRSVNTRVLGTSFNVSAYQELRHSVVTVATGRVRVSSSTRVLSTITPGYQVNYGIAKGDFHVSQADATQVSSWMQGQSVLNQASFAELALIIRNMYGIKLNSQNKAIPGYKYNIHINASHSIDETMRVICSVHQNTYRRKNNEIIIQ